MKTATHHILHIPVNLTSTEIIKFRCQLGYDQKRFGQLINRSERSIRTFESGRSKIPTEVSHAIRFLMSHQFPI